MHTKITDRYEVVKFKSKGEDRDHDIQDIETIKFLLRIVNWGCEQVSF